MDCCSNPKNLIPILYTYYKEGQGEVYGVSHFVCAECMDNICVDDSLDRYSYKFKNINHYINTILKDYNIEEYKYIDLKSV